MKKTFLFLAAFAGLALSAAAKGEDPVIIRGRVHKPGVHTVYLYNVVEGNMYQYASTRINADSVYTFALENPKEGFWYVGDNIPAMSLKHRFYLKEGERINLDLYPTKSVLTAKSKENKALAEWQDIWYEIYAPAAVFTSYRETYVGYFPLLEKTLAKRDAFRKKINTGNKSFDAYLQWMIDNDTETAAVGYLQTPQSKHPKKEDYPAYYRTIVQPGKYADARVLQLGDAGRRISSYMMFSRMINPAQGAPTIDEQLSLVANDTLKGFVLVNSMGRYKVQEMLQTEMAPYEKYLLTDSLKAKYKAYDRSLATLGKGTKAFPFNYPDIEGKNVSLASLKGQVVLVDTWATWCGPCKAEIPHLKQLEKELEGHKIAIVSLSVDKKADEQKWKDFVKNEKLGGIQLYANGSDEFLKYYNITGIPRFLVFDQQGNIVTVDAPRPSSPDLKKLLLSVEKRS
ncbi:TlpA family protein disulfide reductase [Chitinophaga lutea]